MTSLLPRLNAWLNSPDEGPELPVLHRLALVYFVLPLIVWLVGWFAWWVGILAAVCLTAGFWNALRGSWWGPPRPAVFALPIVAAGWVLLTPAGGMVGLLDDVPTDWLKHRALFSELGANAWPVWPANPLHPYLPAGEADAGAPLLRYYLGWYMVPGLAARWLGLAALNWAVPVWCWGGVALVVLLFAAGCRGWRETVLAVAVLVGFSGMDLLRNVLLHGMDWVDWRTAFRFDGLWPTVGLQRGLVEWPRFDGVWVYLQYSANTTGLMFLPQHTVSAALGALLVVQLSDRPRFLAVSGVLLAAVVFWSPFAALGLLPLLAVPVCTHGLRPFLRWQNLLLAPPVGLLLVTYLTSGAQEVPSGFLWEQYDAGTLAKLMPVFYLTEFGILAGLLVWLQPGPEPEAAERPHARRRARSRKRKKAREHPSSWSARGRALVGRDPFLAASVATLFVLPVYSFGLYNDLPMNASKPAVFVLGYCCVCGLVAYGRNGGKGARRLALGGLIGVLAVGAFTPLVEVVRAGNYVGAPSVLRYERGPYSLFTDLIQSLEYQYVSYEVPPAVRAVLRDTDAVGTPTRAKGERIVAADFDVYLDGKRLIWTKTPCGRQDVEPIFILNVTPADEDDLSDVSRRAGLSFDNLNFTFALNGRRRGETYVAFHRLPDYAIARIVVGQGVAGQRPTWIREYRFDPRQDSAG